MEQNMSRFTLCSKSTYLISVTSYENKTMAGYLRQPHLDIVVQFDNLMQLLLQMEAIMDEAKYPQRCMEPRAFREDYTAASIQSHTIKALPTGMANLQVDVLFRQNASWQGNLVWRDRGMQSHFRSALELLGLIDDILVMAAE